MQAVQRSFDDLGEALVDVTFCVVDLETTGGAPGSSAITEIGAVKVRGGELLGEFATLVDPGCDIPPFITVLTGITNAMVIGAPKIDEALPSFLEFAGDSVLVAHNASFDSRFISYEAMRLGYGRPGNPVVCTVRLARRLVRDEVSNLRLETLARALRGRQPSHRALDDARAATDVLHALLELAGRWGVKHLDDLLWFQSAGGHPQARKRMLTEQLPRGPGVYMFLDGDGRLLYVGKAADLRSRVRSYFSADDRRSIGSMLRELTAIEHHPTRMPIEAAILEARLIRRHKPPYNRAQRGRLASAWVRLTSDRFPRVTIARRESPGAIGPLSSAAATAVREALEEAAPIRRCNDRIGTQTRFPPCVLAEIGRCPAPCDARVSVDEYADGLGPVVDVLQGDPRLALEALDARMAALSAQSRYEEAAGARDRAAALVRALSRQRTADSLRRAGRLVLDAAGTVVVLEGGNVSSVAGRVLAVPPDGHPDEARLIAAWLRKDRSVRLLSAGGAYVLPATGGGALAAWESRLAAASRRRTG